MALATVNTNDGFSWTGATGSTVGPFALLGGKYMLATEAAGTSVTLQVVDQAGNAIPVTNAAFTTSAGTIMVDLPPGSYQVVVVSASGVAGFLQKVPYLPAY